ncbi:hypothetical protein AAVH_33849 [Aphelenchoides avenae]|nr:hypothetical protein AAVH_33849 [Aphelenchus avenae]
MVINMVIDPDTNREEVYEITYLDNTPTKWCGKEVSREVEGEVQFRSAVRWKRNAGADEFFDGALYFRRRSFTREFDGHFELWESELRVRLHAKERRPELLKDVIVEPHAERFHPGKVAHEGIEILPNGQRPAVKDHVFGVRQRRGILENYAGHIRHENVENQLANSVWPDDFGDLSASGHKRRMIGALVVDTSLRIERLVLVCDPAGAAFNAKTATACELFGKFRGQA